MALLQVVVGGQAGSEGKGAVAAYLSSKHESGVAVRVAGPNAGHTVIGRCPPDCPDTLATFSNKEHPGMHGRDEHPWRLRQVPVAAVSNPNAALVIAQGSEIDPGVLADEVRLLDMAGYDVSQRLLVDGAATIIERRHLEAEVMERDGMRPLTDRIGSTGKGIGAARAARAMRTAILARDYTFSPLRYRVLGDIRDRYHYITVQDGLASMLRYNLRHGGEVLIEGTQGYLLGQHAEYYPQCTSSDCTAIDFLAMAGVSPWEVPADDLEIWVVFRTYPIRVAGNSGPLPGETTWEDLGIEPELTTVTRKVRRVGQWDPGAARAAMAANGHGNNKRSPVRVALTMADYVVPGLAGLTSLDGADDSVRDALDVLIAERSSDLNAAIRLVGTGPSSLIDLRSE